MLLRIRQRYALFPVLVFTLAVFANACTMTVHAVVENERGDPVADAVVFATEVPDGTEASAAVDGTPFSGQREGMSLQGRAIVPSVLPVRTGTAVSFSNRDSIQHHVYSISPVKQFEFTIEKGASSPGLVFDRPGVVIIGSAINDLLIGYIYVLRTPWYARTGADGRADLRGIPRGTYDVRVWHPGMKRSPDATARRLSPAQGRESSMRFPLALPQAKGLSTGPSGTAASEGGGK